MTLSSKTLKAISTFRGSEVKGRRASLFFSAGIHDEFTALERGGSDRGTFKANIVKASIAADKADAKEAGIPFHSWVTSRHSVKANVETDLKCNTRFESNEEYLDAGYDNDSEGFARFLNEQSIGNFAQWNQWYFKNTAAGKVTAKKEAAKRKAKKEAAAKDVSFKSKGKKGEDNEPDLDAADTVLECLKAQAEANDIDMVTLWDMVGDRMNEMLAATSEEATG